MSSARGGKSSSKGAKSDKWFYLLSSAPDLAAATVDPAALRVGPFTGAEMKQHWHSGKIVNDTLVWKSKMKEGWMSAQECEPFLQLIQEDSATQTSSKEDSNFTAANITDSNQINHNLDPTPLVSTTTQVAPAAAVVVPLVESAPSSTETASSTIPADSTPAQSEPAVAEPAVPAAQTASEIAPQPIANEVSAPRRSTAVAPPPTEAAAVVTASNPVVVEFTPLQTEVDTEWEEPPHPTFRTSIANAAEAAALRSRHSSILENGAAVYTRAPAGSVVDGPAFGSNAGGRLSVSAVHAATAAMAAAAEAAEKQSQMEVSNAHLHAIEEQAEEAVPPPPTEPVEEQQNRKGSESPVPPPPDSTTSSSNESISTTDIAPPPAPETPDDESIGIPPPPPAEVEEVIQPPSAAAKPVVPATNSITTSPAKTIPKTAAVASPASPAFIPTAAPAPSVVVAASTSSPIPVVPTQSGSVADKLRDLQRLEHEAKTRPVVSSTAVHAARGSIVGGQKTKAQLWKENFGSKEELKSIPRTAATSTLPAVIETSTPSPSSATSTSSASAVAAVSTPTHSAPAVNSALSPAHAHTSSIPDHLLSPGGSSTLSLKERSVFATVGSSTISSSVANPLASTSASSAASSLQPKLSLFANSWSGTNSVQSNKHWIAATWGAKGNELMVTPIDRFDKHLQLSFPTSGSPTLSSDFQPSNATVVLQAHAVTNPILDFAFNPFQPDEIATGSNDGVIKFWTLPASSQENATRIITEGSFVQTIATPAYSIALEKPSHIEMLKVQSLQYNPAAGDVLAASIAPLDCIQIFDLTSKSLKATASVGSAVFHMAWSPNGRQIATTSADRLLKIFDIRAAEPGTRSAQTTNPISDSTKASRLVWLDDATGAEVTKIATLSFNRDSSRVLSIFDRRQLGSGPLHVEIVDSHQINQPMMFYHPLQRLLILSGKGDANLKFLEFNKELDKVTYLNEYKLPSGKPHRGMCIGMPAPPMGLTPAALAAANSAAADELPNLYRMAPSAATGPGVASSLASNKDASAASGFIEMVRLRRSDILHRALVRRRQTIEKESSAATRRRNDGLPQMNAEQFFSPPRQGGTESRKQLHHHRGGASSILPPSSLSPGFDHVGTPGASPSASGPDDDFSAVGGSGPSAFDVLVKDLLPLLRTSDQRAHFQTSTQANLAMAAQLGAAAGKNAQQLSDLAHFRSVITSLSSGALATGDAESRSALAQLEDVRESLQEAQEKCAEYETMLGAASLAQKKFLDKIAALERSASESKGDKKSSASSSSGAPAGTISNIATASSAGVDPSQSKHDANHHHSAHSSLATSVLLSQYNYPKDLEANLSMFLQSNVDLDSFGEELENGHFIHTSNASSNSGHPISHTIEPAASVWGWEEFGSASAEKNSNTVSTSAPSIPRTIPASAVDSLLSVHPHAPVQLFDCPRLGIGLEMGFPQFHSLVYLQSVSTMHLQMP